MTLFSMRVAVLILKFCLWSRIEILHATRIFCLFSYLDKGYVRIAYQVVCIHR